VLQADLGADLDFLVGKPRGVRAARQSLSRQAPMERAIDWGTSSNCAARCIDAQAARVDSKSAAMRAASSPCRRRLSRCSRTVSFGDWMRGPGARCLISGMAGSKQGWVEAPYCACPAGACRHRAAKVIAIDHCRGASRSCLG
jgi:2-dehydro-3-deoxygalactonokinase